MSRVRRSCTSCHRGTEVQETMDKQLQARWRQTEAEPRDLCKSNSAQVQSLAAKLHENELENQQLHTAQERQLQLEAQALGRSQDLEQKACSIAHESEIALREVRRKAEEQPQVLKTQWKLQLSQQASYKAEIHELYTEMLNMCEESELQAALSAKMHRLEQPSLTVEPEPENVLNTASPGRSSSWILPSELMTPARPTTGGIQTPTGPPVQYGPSTITQQYGRPRDLAVPPAQWGEREPDEEECELFGEPVLTGGKNTQAPLNRIFSWRARTSCRLRESLDQQRIQSHPAQVPSDGLKADLFVLVNMKKNLHRQRVTPAQSRSTPQRSSTRCHCRTTLFR